MSELRPERDIKVLEYEVKILSANFADLQSHMAESFDKINARLDGLAGGQASTAFLLRLVVGEGQPGQGRLGEAERSLEKMKKIWWQAAGAIGVLVLLVKLIFKF